MKRLSTLLTTMLIALIVLMAAPSAMADPGKGSNAAQVLNCAKAALNPEKRWFGKFGACIAYHRADNSAGKIQPPTPPKP